MSLERISFRKPRGHAPLVSPLPPSKGGESHDERFFKDWEIKILLDHYQQEGPAACKARLPHRVIGSIYRKANELGLRARNNPGARQSHPKTAEIDAKIRERWPHLKGRGAITEFAEELGRPKWWVSRRARDLGMANVPFHKEPEWTAAELQLLKKVPLHDSSRAAAIFRQHGFHRTPTSIVVKSKRQGLSRRYTETMSARQVAEILGVDSKYVTARCIDGALTATRRETLRGPQQGGDPWSITRADLRRYIIENVTNLDIRKVEKFSFVQLLAEGKPAPNVAHELNLATGVNGAKFDADAYRAGQVAMRQRAAFMVSPAIRSAILALELEARQ